MPAGIAYPSGHLVPSLFQTFLCSNCWDQFSLTVFYRPFAFEFSSVPSPFCFLLFGCQKYTRRGTGIYTLVQMFCGCYTFLCPHFLYNVLHYVILNACGIPNSPVRCTSQTIVEYPCNSATWSRGYANGANQETHIRPGIISGFQGSIF